MNWLTTFTADSWSSNDHSSHEQHSMNNFMIPIIFAAALSAVTAQVRGMHNTNCAALITKFI